MRLFKRLFENNPQYIHDIKTNINNIISGNKKATLKEVTNNRRKRPELSINANSDLFED